VPRHSCLWIYGLTLFLCGCYGAGQGMQRKPRNPAADQQASPAELLHRCLDARVSLTSLKAEATMRLTDEPHKFTLGVNTELLAQKPDRLRIRATKALGRVEAFETLMIGSEIAFYVPRKRTLYRGKLEDLGKADVRFDPQEILRRMLQPDVGLLLRRWRRIPAQTDAPNLVLEEIVHGRGRLRLVIAPETYDLLRVDQYDLQGTVVFQQIYGSYREPPDAISNAPVVLPEAPGARDKPRAYTRRFPFAVELSWPQEQRAVVITFKHLEPDAFIPEDLWLLDVPERTREEPLGKAELEGDADAETNNTGGAQGGNNHSPPR